MADGITAVPRVEIIGVPGLKEVVEGDDLADLIVTALGELALPLRDGDVVVVSSKIVSKAEGRRRHAGSRDAAVDAETVHVVAERRGERGVTRIVRSRSGPVTAAAGVDASNVEPGTVLLLPEDPDASASALRRGLVAASGAEVGVVVSDTGGRAWRDGQVDFALGVAGVRPVDDLRGATDVFGTPLEVTVRALADELASAADLVKGKLHGVPVAVVRGLRTLVLPDDGPGARSLLRPVATDWFALGHVEAVRSALGVPPGTPGIPPAPLVPDGVVPRLRRALDVAAAAPGPWGEAYPGVPDATVCGTPDGGAVAVISLTPLTTRPATALTNVTGPGTLLAAGALVQRVVAAAWSEGLTAVVHLTGDELEVRARLR
ncbi:MAG: coenzyme F420-0:L-glutamate ligase / coenzyme F420:gamma-L-glutamate ligase [Actinomycetota bacterium]|nr:coenzyme F420-0:L-glutamate ligase / coenzyme F420:gamma-L-glutamate ligase [Actinomycetota bacterium]